MGHNLFLLNIFYIIIELHIYSSYYVEYIYIVTYILYTFVLIYSYKTQAGFKLFLQTIKKLLQQSSKTINNILLLL